MAPVLTPEHVIINHATVSPTETIEAAAIVTDRHAAYLDAPFTGSRDAAQAGQLIYYIGGDPAVLERVRPLLQVSSKSILAVGDIGHAAIVKIATNVISAAAASALTEALALLDSHGVPLQHLSRALESNAARSPVIDMKFPCMVSGEFDPRFSLKNMFKDVQLAIAAADTKNLELPTASAFAGIAMAGIERGWGDADFSVISRFYGYPGRESSPPPLPDQNSPEADSSQPQAPRLRNFWNFFQRNK
jgi:3-hydroxyisobutyrate dehydrogenase